MTVTAADVESAYRALETGDGQQGDGDGGDAYGLEQAGRLEHESSRG